MNENLFVCIDIFGWIIAAVTALLVTIKDRQQLQLVWALEV